MKLKASVLALFAAGLLVGLTQIAPAGADGPATTTTTTATTPSTPTTTTTTTTTSTTPSTAGAQDAISALSDHSITVGQLTCTIGSSSPAVTFKVGDRVRIGCLNGALYSISAAPSPTTTTQPTAGAPALSGFSPASGAPGTVVQLSGSGFTGALAVKFYGVPADYTVNSDTSITTKLPWGAISGQITVVSPTAGDITSTASFTVPSNSSSSTSTSSGSSTTHAGTITALSSTSITVDTVTCSIGPSSPNPLAYGFQVGDHAGIGCSSGVLVKISTAGGDGPSGTPSTTTTTTTTTTPHTSTVGSSGQDNFQTRLGTIASLNATSITVDGLTCTIAASSPSTSGFNVGDQVGIGCDNGTLVKIGDAPFGGDNGGFNVAVQVGSIARLTSDLIRVGNLACELADTSPDVSSFNVGDRVGIGCAGGILFMIGAIPSSTSGTPATTVKQVLKQHLSSCLSNGNETCTFGSALKRFSHPKT